MNKEDFDNFEECFQHIDDSFKVLADELNQQFIDAHMSYIAELTFPHDGGDVPLTIDNYLSEDGDFITFRYDLSKESDRKLFIYHILEDVLKVLLYKTTDRANLDPWCRIKGIMALRLRKEDVQSPISAAEYEEIKITAEKSKALDLESVYVNNQRPEWTEEQQIELIMKKEKGV